MSIIDPGMEAMLETFIHETDTMLEQLDEILLDSERARSLSEENINNIFRITHTIKGSAAMMDFESVSTLAHAVEDVFYVLREDPSKLSMVFNDLFDLVLASSDFLKAEMEKLQQQDEYQQGNALVMIDSLHKMAALLKGEAPLDPISATEAAAEVKIPESLSNVEDITRIRVFFEDDCQMENMRAFMLMTQLQHCCDLLDSSPSHPENDSSSSNEIIKNGFVVLCRPSTDLEEVLRVIESCANIKSYEVLEETQPEAPAEETIHPAAPSEHREPAAAGTISGKPSPSIKTGGAKQNLISVNQSKLDQLMDLVGELVTEESMVARNPDLRGLKLDNFNKSIRELRKLTDELQDIVMAIRMVPIQSTFNKMDRIVRDMCKKLDKKAELICEGGDTEVDKTINDAIADPMMHMVRNSMDHAIEAPEERIRLGKPEVGRVSLTARNVGGEIHIEIADDGAGLNSDVLMAKAKKNGLLTKPEADYSEKEIFNFIMMPGFSTNSEVTEFSGRGVGMDVVRKNIEQVGGSLSISSVRGQGTTFLIKIPLTLAIITGMNVSVGNTVFTLPITTITQSFKVSDASQIIHNTNGSEMIMLRGECYPVFRLHRIFGIETKVEDITEGILMQVESSSRTACLFADELLGEYQVVVKPFPTFFNKYDLKQRGLSGCSILGDGSISLILDANSLLNDL